MSLSPSLPLPMHSTRCTLLCSWVNGTPGQASHSTWSTAFCTGVVLLTVALHILPCNHTSKQAVLVRGPSPATAVLYCRTVARDTWGCAGRQATLRLWPVDTPRQAAVDAARTACLPGCEAEHKDPDTADDAATGRHGAAVPLARLWASIRQPHSLGICGGAAQSSSFSRESLELGELGELQQGELGENNMAEDMNMRGVASVLVSWLATASSSGASQ
eukprot:CAMPEP_0202859408 /NCGR_PEP_ID=MMETSP1391-20130828/1535_1 /ASSEMBLY_ACC=CAM_ASM_000867 /TAXON_ID=1034604 /ORGANISM="Chlamydomonas leiostraca, Strain SAG 11-49" /LENGTH=217 /DNA_ID=CAMNT_0049538441 /DNA_START=757 /DNA_END=1411 /DNA_ORIENTATION=+